MAQNIPRRKFKGTGARKASSEDNTPDFYRMSPLPPLAETRSETTSPPTMESEEIRDPAPPSSRLTQLDPRTMYDMIHSHRRSENLYSPSMSRHAVPDTITVSEGPHNYDSLAQRDRIWADRNQPNYFGCYNAHQRTPAFQRTLCRSYGK